MHNRVTKDVKVNTYKEIDQVTQHQKADNTKICIKTDLMTEHNAHSHFVHRTCASTYTLYLYTFNDQISLSLYLIIFTIFQPKFDKNFRDREHWLSKFLNTN